MKQLPFFLLLVMLSIYGCNTNPQSQTRETESQVEESKTDCQEETKNDITLYRDTIIGVFNGKDIDTLICEPIDMTKEQCLWDWNIRSKQNTV